MVATSPTNSNQGFCPVPAIRQNIEFTRERKSEPFENPFGQNDLGLERARSSCSLGMVEFCPEGEEKLFIEQGREDPLMAEDIGHMLSMIFIPTTSWNLSACLLDDGIVDDEKENRRGFDLQRVEELGQSRLHHPLHGPYVLAQESGKTRERSMQNRETEGLNHRGGMSFFAQLDKADDEGREDLERGS